MRRSIERGVLRSTLRASAVVLLLPLACAPNSPPKSTSPNAEPSPTPAPPQEEPAVPAAEESGAGNAAPTDLDDAPEAEGAPRKEMPAPVAPPARQEVMERSRRAAPKKQPQRGYDALGSQPSLEQLRSRLDQLSSTPAADCSDAERQKRAICSLAEQLCAMVDRDPNVASVDSYCQEARARCRHAEAQIREHCEAER